jgi:hypothetical protein
MASNLCVCVYTHGYYTLKKEREEEDNETLAQLKAFFFFFFLPFLFFYIQETRGRVTQPLNRVGEEKKKMKVPVSNGPRNSLLTQKGRFIINK